MSDEHNDGSILVSLKQNGTIAMLAETCERQAETSPAPSPWFIVTELRRPKLKAEHNPKKWHVDDRKFVILSVFYDFEN